MTGKKLITCVYCGHEYPEQTPTSGAQILKDHIKICEKHPMREAEEKIKKLRKSLSELVCAETKDDLECMELMLRQMPGIEKDKIAAINAIHALLETAD